MMRAVGLDVCRPADHITQFVDVRMAGKICIVTGAAQGFGKGIAQELYNEGATVVIADMNEPLAKQAKFLLEPSRPDFEFSVTMS